MTAVEPQVPVTPPPRAQTRRSIDRRHWAAKIGIPFNELRDQSFKEQYPFESRLHDIDGYSYHYIDEGEGDPVVMVHGNPTWSYFYRNLVKGLRDHRRCLVPDHMGCGFSEKPGRYTYDLAHHVYNLESWLEAVLPPVDWKGGRIDLIVHDWGGPIGFAYALRHPKRIRRLVVLNTSIFPDGDMPLRIKVCRWPYLGAFLVRQLNLFAKGAARMTTVKPLASDIAGHFVMPYNSWKNRVGVHEFVRDIPLESSFTTGTGDIFRTMGKEAPEFFADTPMLVQWGMQDWCFTPFFLDLWRSRFPKAEIDQYSKAGHYLLEDAGDAILARIKDFLERPLA